MIPGVRPKRNLPCSLVIGLGFALETSPNENAPTICFLLQPKPLHTTQYALRNAFAPKNFRTKFLGAGRAHRFLFKPERLKIDARSKVEQNILCGIRMLQNLQLRVDISIDMTQAQVRNNGNPYLRNDHRRHVRFPHSFALKICELPPRTEGTSPAQFHAAKSKNVSRGGMKISTLATLERHSNALIDVNLRQLERLIGEQTAILIGGKWLLARVAWRKLNLETGLFELGLRFIEERERPEFESVISRAQNLHAAA